MRHIIETHKSSTIQDSIRLILERINRTGPLSIVRQNLPSGAGTVDAAVALLSNLPEFAKLNPLVEKIVEIGGNKFEITDRLEGEATQVYTAHNTLLKADQVQQISAALEAGNLLNPNSSAAVVAGFLNIADVPIPKLGNMHLDNIVLIWEDKSGKILLTEHCFVTFPNAGCLLLPLTPAIKAFVKPRLFQSHREMWERFAQRLIPNEEA